jgi:hypothetical protein
MQFCIELPDDLEPELLQQADVKKLITDAVKKLYWKSKLYLKQITHFRLIN